MFFSNIYLIPNWELFNFVFEKNIHTLLFFSVAQLRLCIFERMMETLRSKNESPDAA